MKNVTYNVFTPAFKSLEINDYKREKVNMLLSSCTDNNREKVKSDLVKILDKDLRQEAKFEARGIHSSEDILQNMYLTLFENFDTASKEKEPAEFIIKLFTNPKTGKKILKSRYDKYTLSLDNPVNNTSKTTFAAYITDGDLPVYASCANAEERKGFAKKLKKVEKKSNLNSKQQKKLTERANGETYKQIAQKNNISYTAARTSILKSVLKIQEKNENIPPEFISLSKDIKNTFQLKHSDEQILKFLINYPPIIAKDINYFKDYAAKAAGYLHIGIDEFVNGTINDIHMYLIKPETIRDNTYKSAKLTGLNPETYISLGLKFPQLFYQKPETINNNIEKVAKYFDISKSEYIKSLKSYPRTICNKPETIIENVIKLSKMMKITPREYVKNIALKNPAMFYIKPETFNKNVEAAKKILGLTDGEFIKLIKRRTEIVNITPQTIDKNLTTLAVLLHKSEKEIINAVKKQPAILSLQPEKVKENISGLAKLMETDFDKCVEIGLKNPPLICCKPENVAKKAEIFKYYKNQIIQKKHNIICKNTYLYLSFS